LEYAISAITLNVKAMMSTEIAELTGKQHKNVMRDIEVIMEQLDEEKISF
jgi:phage regulator Rha-like protein